MRTRLWVTIVIASMPSIAVADKIEDMATNALKAYDVMIDAQKQYAALYANYEKYYKPIAPQWDVVVKTRKAAEDECAKNKRTVACRDKTLLYAAEHKKYNAMVWDKDNADPKHEFDASALTVRDREVKRAQAEFQTRYAETAKAFNAATNKAATKALRLKLDERLAEREQKRSETFAAGRSSTADAKMPKGNPSGNSRTTGSPPSFDPTKTVNDTVTRW
jgi:hypothetical protein